MTNLIIEALAVHGGSGKGSIAGKSATGKGGMYVQVKDVNKFMSKNQTKSGLTRAGDGKRLQRTANVKRFKSTLEPQFQQNYKKKNPGKNWKEGNVAPSNRRQKQGK